MSSGWLVLVFGIVFNEREKEKNAQWFGLAELHTHSTLLQMFSYQSIPQSSQIQSSTLALIPIDMNFYKLNSYTTLKQPLLTQPRLSFLSSPYDHSVITLHALSQPSND